MKKWWFISIVAVLATWAGTFALLRWGQSSRDGAAVHTTTPKRLSDASRRILDESEKVILLSLDPVYSKEPSTQTAEKFHYYPVLGRVEIKDANLKHELLRALYKGVEDSLGLAAACFNPRHGIRAENGTNWIELVICFECSYMEEHGTGASDGAHTTGSPAETFNRVLKDAGVPITTK